MARKWKSDHPDSDPSDPIHEMTRSQQTMIFRLRTGHTRLRQHMYKRFKVGDSELCPCGQAPQNTEDVLQTCSSHKQLRARTWPNHTPLEKKLYGTTEELALTVDLTTLWHRVSLSDRQLQEERRRRRIHEHRHLWSRSFFGLIYFSLFENMIHCTSISPGGVNKVLCILLLLLFVISIINIRLR